MCVCDTDTEREREREGERGWILLVRVNARE